MRLVAALRVAEHVVRRARPKAAGNSWFPIVRSPEEIAAMDPEDERQVPFTSRRSVDKTEAAINWRTGYLRDHDGPARVLRSYLKSKVTRVPFGKVCKDKGWSRATA